MSILSVIWHIIVIIIIYMLTWRIFLTYPFVHILNDLALAGFIEKDSPFDKPRNSKLIRYRLLDEYLNFYFAFILKNVQSIQRGRFLCRDMDHSQLQQWQGYAFERLCRRHAHEIASYLKFAGVRYASGQWFRSGRHEENGVQIDLAFQRQDKVMTVCEIKCVERLSGKKLVSDFEKKMSVLREFFPPYGMQKVLILAKEIPILDNIRKYFDDILFATEVFF